MVSNSDLQTWQATVNGINESGKIDLTGEEWSALTVLNGSLSSGNFDSNENRHSIKLITERLIMHSNNPVLQTHLQNFITLCNKFGALITIPEPQAEAPVASSPVATVDLQKWQQTTNNIVAAQNDLAPNELSAFHALVTLFNSGNFGENESGGYIQTIKNSTTKNRLLTRIYLPTFVALCEKYFKTQVSTPIGVASTSGSETRQTNTSGASKKSGSNSLLILIIVAGILGVGYYMVKDSDWFSNLFPMGENTIGNYDNILEVRIPNGNKYSAYIDSVSLGFGKGIMSNTVSYNNGNFTLKLKDIPEERLKPFGNLKEGAIISDPEAQFYSDKYLSLIGAYKNDEIVGYISLHSSNYYLMPLYVDRKCEISGFSDGTTYNISLRKGWNKIYISEDGIQQVITITLPSGLEWRVTLNEQYRTNEPEERVNRIEQTEQVIIIEQADKQAVIPGRFPQASERLLTASDLQHLSKEDLKIMRNEIFARHGYIFQTQAMKTHFQNQNWYTPRYTDVNSMLTNIEQKNIALIKRYE